jgi:hypothetical protein
VPGIVGYMHANVLLVSAAPVDAAPPVMTVAAQRA